MHSAARRFALLSLVSAAAIGCSTTRVPDSPSPSHTRSSTSVLSSAKATPGVNDAANGVSFTRPARWMRTVPNAHDPMTDGPLIYLSTDPLLPTCATAPDVTPNPADAAGRACDWPLVNLAPNGVLVTWLTTRILVPLPSAGEVAQVNGHAARLQIARPGSCSAIGGDETLYVLVPIGQPKPWSNVAVLACLRGPNLVEAEADVRAMLASATVSP
jgi:hypothetical protein